ncbi:MAG: YidC/Oxa1 family membrane protein insertase [Patescibacteria group bacterium]
MPAHDLGLAIIVLTVIIRLLFFPLSIKSQRSQKALNAISPHIQALKEKHKDNQAAQGEAMMKLYKEHNINPIAGCLPILIQLPILIALYQAFIAGLKPESLSLLYPFVHNPGVVNPIFIGFLSLTGRNIILAVVAGLLQFLQAKQSANYMKTSGVGANPQMAALNKQMLYFFPIMIVVIGWNLPAGLILYWITTTAFSIGEQFYLKRTT